MVGIEKMWNPRNIRNLDIIGDGNGVGSGQRRPHPYPPCLFKPFPILFSSPFSFFFFVLSIYNI